MEDKIKLLKTIEKVESPDYMATRIQAAINKSEKEEMVVPWRFVFGIGLLLLVNGWFGWIKKDESALLDLSYQPNYVYYEGK